MKSRYAMHPIKPKPTPSVESTKIKKNNTTHHYRHQLLYLYVIKALKILENKLNYQSYLLFEKWYTTTNNEWIVCKCSDNIHFIPKFEIYTNETLIITLPNCHEIYNQFFHSFWNKTLLNLIKVLNSYGCCC